MKKGIKILGTLLMMVIVGGASVAGTLYFLNSKSSGKTEDKNEKLYIKDIPTDKVDTGEQITIRFAKIDTSTTMDNPEGMHLNREYHRKYFSNGFSSYILNDTNKEHITIIVPPGTEGKIESITASGRDYIDLKGTLKIGTDNDREYAYPEILWETELKYTFMVDEILE